jgi:intein/homing endonuclease
MNIGKIEDIPLTQQTAYLAGVIVGDGHISNSFKSKTDKSKDYRIVIELGELEFLQYVVKEIKEIVSTKSVVKKVKKSNSHIFQVRNKSFYHFLTQKLSIPSGKKSSIVSIPEKIKYANDTLKKSFIAGLFDTDGDLGVKELDLLQQVKLFRMM